MARLLALFLLSFQAALGEDGEASCILQSHFPFQNMMLAQHNRSHHFDQVNTLGAKLTELWNVPVTKKNMTLFPTHLEGSCRTTRNLRRARVSVLKVKELDKKATGQEVGATALVWLKLNADGYDCSAKKFFTDEDYVKWVEKANEKPGGCGPGDLLLIIAGPKLKTQESMGKFRHLMGTELGLRNEGFRALWVVNFPMLEWDDDEERFCAKHHPFTSPWTEDIDKMVSLDHKDQKLLEVRANAYDMVINGVEVGGGSVRIHDRSLQEKVFEVLGFSKEEALAQFGFLMGAFEYGAPPHAGLAFGLDRLCTIIGGKTTIRDFIAFPKNNMGRDTMINTPAAITSAQLAELSIETTVDEEGKPKAKAGYP